MPRISFTIEVECEDDEPSHVAPEFRGEIFEYLDDADDEAKIGQINGYFFQRGRAIEEGESLFEVMDSIDGSTREFFDALFDKSGEWKDSVETLYNHEIPLLDVLFIEKVELDPEYRGKEIGGLVVRETIATLGQSCGLVACKPFALQYEGWMAEENKAKRKQPGFEKKRLADFAKVIKFWTDLGFRNVPGSDFYTFAPHLLQQPKLHPKTGSHRGK